MLFVMSVMVHALMKQIVKRIVVENMIKRSLMKRMSSSNYLVLHYLQH